MLRTQKSRAIVATVTLVLGIIFGIATIGYFVGFSGVETGWPSFWAVANVAFLTMCGIAVLFAAVALLILWVNGGESRNG